MRDLGFVERGLRGVIPLALAGADIIASAETGTGKTCAFVLPILQRLLTKGLEAWDWRLGPTAPASGCSSPQSPVPSPQCAPQSQRAS